MIKSWNTGPLMPKFEGPFQVLLVSNSAVRTREKGWTHITRIKGPVSPPGTGPDHTPLPSPGTARDSTTSRGSSPEYTVIKGPSDLKLTLRRQSQKD